MKNLIHLHGIPFILACLEVKPTFNQHLKIPMIDNLNKIWRPEVQNRYIPLDYSDEIVSGLFDYTHYGKSVFKPKVDCKAHTRNDIITYNQVDDWINLTQGLKIGDTEYSELRARLISIIKKYQEYFC